MITVLMEILSSPEAFAFLAIRTILELPISFPTTTGCAKPTVGGKIIEIK